MNTITFTDARVNYDELQHIRKCFYMHYNFAVVPVLTDIKNWYYVSVEIPGEIITDEFKNELKYFLRGICVSMWAAQ